VVLVTFLGTGNAFGSGGRHPVSLLLEGEGQAALLECGPATLAALKRSGRRPEAIELILVSHHHGDHFAGIPFLLLDYLHFSPGRRPLAIAGPPGTESKIEALAALLFPGMESKPRGFAVDYREMRAGEPVGFGPLEATAFRVSHFPQGVAFGYRVRLGGRTVVYSGDTEWTEELARQSADADLFICECSSFAEKLDFHLSHRDLESRRERIHARRTLLIHAGDDVLAERARLAFELAEEGMEVRL
jgi:ribonuclease BN (tRNA processing enzyme)